MAEEAIEVAGKPSKIKIEARVSATDDDAARKLAAKKEIAIADVYSQAIERGLPLLIEEDNSRDHWLKNLEKSEIKSLTENLSEEQLRQAIEFLKGLQ